MKRLRVALDGRTLANPVLRGMDRYVLGLLRHLPEFHVDVTLFHREREPIPAVHAIGLSTRCLSLPDRSGMWWEQVSVPRALHRGRYDLYHSPAERTLPIVAPCPCVYSLHSATENSYERLVRLGALSGRVEEYLGYDPAAARRHWKRRIHDASVRLSARRILTVSEYARREIVDLLHVPAGRVSVTPLGLADEFRQPVKPTHDLTASLTNLGVRQPYLLFVGGFERHKNTHGLIDAFAVVRAVRPDLALVMAGTGAVPASVDDGIRRAGLVRGRDVLPLSDLRAELVDLYDGAELFVSLSWRESFGLPALEAMSRGVGVVASAWGATPEVVGPAGRFVDPRFPASAACAILEFLAVPADQRAAAARDRARTFTWRETARLTAVAYRDCLAGRKQP